MRTLNQPECKIMQRNKNISNFELLFGQINPLK